MSCNEMTQYSSKVHSPSPRRAATAKPAATPAKASATKAATATPASETAAVPASASAALQPSSGVLKQAHKEGKNSNHYPCEYRREKEPP